MEPFEDASPLLAHSHFPQGQKELDTSECLIPCPWGSSSWAQWVGVSSQHCRLWGIAPQPQEMPLPLDLISDPANQNLQKTTPILSVCVARTRDSCQGWGLLPYTPATLSYLLSSFQHHRQNWTLGCSWEPLRDGHLGWWSLEVFAEQPAPAGGQLPSPIAGSGLLQPLPLLLLPLGQ